MWLSLKADPGQPDCSQAASAVPAWALTTGATCEEPVGLSSQEEGSRGSTRDWD